jgi:hypothetical protein
LGTHFKDLRAKYLVDPPLAGSRKFKPNPTFITSKETFKKNAGYKAIAIYVTMNSIPFGFKHMKKNWEITLDLRVITWLILPLAGSRKFKPNRTFMTSKKTFKKKCRIT